MLDWLKRNPREAPFVEIGGQRLPILVRRRARARRMTLRLSPDGSEAHVSIPEWGRTDQAVAFARSRRDWLERQLAALPRPQPLVSGAVVRWRGEPLVIDHRGGLPRKPHRHEGFLRLGGPEQSIAPRIRRWLEGEARMLLDEDLAHYCARAGEPPARLALSSARRRWGSCAPSGTIRINWRLVMAPDAVRRSVVAHEVAHLVHFDHSPSFHALLGELFDEDLDAANRWLKREGRGLYLPFG